MDAILRVGNQMLTLFEEDSRSIFLSALLCLFLLVVGYVIIVYKRHRKLAAFPSPPCFSYFWGHISPVSTASNLEHFKQ